MVESESDGVSEMPKKREMCPEDYYEIVVNVLGHHEDEKWSALALEMDLRGYGNTFQEALDDLCDLIGMQISFAFFKGQPEMVFKPAERKYFKTYEEIRNQRIMEMIQQQRDEEGDYEIRGLPIPPALVADYVKKQAYAQIT